MSAPVTDAFDYTVSGVNPLQLSRRQTQRRHMDIPHTRYLIEAKGPETTYGTRESSFPLPSFHRYRSYHDYPCPCCCHRHAYNSSSEIRYWVTLEDFLPTAIRDSS